MRDLETVGTSASVVLKAKLLLVRDDPYREKSLRCDVGGVFRIRFNDRGRDLRAIYAVRGNTIILLGVIERKHGYRELRELLQDL